MQFTTITFSRRSRRWRARRNGSRTARGSCCRRRLARVSGLLVGGQSRLVSEWMEISQRIYRLYKPTNISPVNSSSIHVLISSGALERCLRVIPHHSASTRAWHEHQCFMKVIIYVSVIIQASRHAAKDRAMVPSGSRGKRGAKCLCHGSGGFAEMYGDCIALVSYWACPVIPVCV